MKVIVAGFPKTGTKSMHCALEMLGYSIYDFQENVILLNDEYSKIVKEGWTTEDFRRMYENVDAAMDFPICFFWEEISKAFPDAKIVLTIRDDEEVWLRSYVKHMEAIDQSVAARLLEILSVSLARMRIWLNILWPICLGVEVPSRFRWKSRYNKSMLKLKYRSHNAYVKQNAPKDKLLVYKCSEGWEPLCNFLGVSVPDEPFPHKNIGGSLVKEMYGDLPLVRKIRNEATVSLLILTTATVAAGVCLYKYGASGIVSAVREMFPVKY